MPSHAMCYASCATSRCTTSCSPLSFGPHCNCRPPCPPVQVRLVFPASRCLSETNYTFIVAAANGVGEGPWSSPCVFITPPRHAGFSTSVQPTCKAAVCSQRHAVFGRGHSHDSVSESRTQLTVLRCQLHCCRSAPPPPLIAVMFPPPPSSFAV